MLFDPLSEFGVKDVSLAIVIHNYTLLFLCEFHLFDNFFLEENEILITCIISGVLNALTVFKH